MGNSPLTAPLPPTLGATVPGARAAGAPSAHGQDVVSFALHANPKFLKCLAQYPGDPARQPNVRVAVVRGSLDDELFVVGKYIKPNLRFELFTVEHTPLEIDGSADPSFRHFGLAWYQADLEADPSGVLGSHIRAVLLDQSFGFDAAIGLAQSGTFHVGLWFGDPADVAPSRFDVDKGTAWESAHGGGPLAMISVPVAATGLGPLCTHPSMWVSLVNRHL